MNSEISSTPEPENTENIILEPATPSDSSQANDAIAEPALDSSQEREKSGQTEESNKESDSGSEIDVDFLTDLAPLESVATQPEVNVVVANVSDDNSTEPNDERTELFVDTWLDEKEEIAEEDSKAVAVDNQIGQLEQQKSSLEQEIAELRTQKEQLLLVQMREAQENINRLIEEGTEELIERKTKLRSEIEKLERRKERINQEMRSSFAGSSKELAIRVQGFKEYLVGSLQDLATAADKLDLVRSEAPPTRKRESRSRDDLRMESRGGRRNSEGRVSRGERGRDSRRNSTDLTRNRRGEPNRTRGNAERSNPGQFSEPTFADQSRRIRQLLDQYCNSPDYYGSPWQLRRTFDQSQARKVQEWFFTQGGRGAIDSMGSRLQNILVASAVISILHNIYRDRTQVLILTDTPENLGEWRKGLEDCLGISRRDFGANRGVVLFDSPEVLVQRAERLIADKLLPVIIIDEETEELLNLSMLKFPIWLAFASTNKPASANYLY